MQYRFSNIATACMCLLFLCISFSAGQDVSTTPATKNASENEPAEPLTIKLSVNEILLDVVVLDKKGNPVTDLTADDFEVYQDNKRQEITSGVYIDSQSDAIRQNATDGRDTHNLQLQSLPELKKEDVRRTILFLVDNYSMSFENGYYTKMALRNLVEKQMQPGDLVAIFRTEYGNSALNMFLSDKREVLARINALPPTMVTLPVAPQLYGAAEYNYREFNSMSARRLDVISVGRALAIHGDFMQRAKDALKANLSFGIRALKNMPGRKIMNTITNTRILNDDYDRKILEMKDEALRAGVVINVLNIMGLGNFVENGADASLSGNALMLAEIISRFERALDTADQLPEKTGGVYIRDSNFFLDGLGRETESLMRGYYLISYAPPLDTFAGRGKRVDYRRLKVKVNRKDAVVYTRDGFFGRLESEMDADTTLQDPLIKAIYSPFQSTDLNVDIAAGYVKGAKEEYLVRSWIHLDPGKVKIVETKEGNRIDLEAVYVASDINGNIMESKRVEFSLSGFNADWVRKHGIRFSTLLPVKKPGPYYIRISIQDKESGNLGSAYQFLEIPDLKKKGMALSNIFMITSAEDLQWMNSKETAEGVFSPAFQGEEVRSPALRRYEPGDKLQTLALLYNADAKAIERSEIEIQTILYKDGKEFQRGEPAPVAIESAETAEGIPILRRFTLGSNMPPGDYVLQLVVADKKNSRSNEGASSQTGFTVK